MSVYSLTLDSLLPQVCKGPEELTEKNRQCYYTPSCRTGMRLNNKSLRTLQCMLGATLISSPPGLFPDLIHSCCDTKNSLDQQSKNLAGWNVFHNYTYFLSALLVNYWEDMWKRIKCHIYCLASVAIRCIQPHPVSSNTHTICRHTLVESLSLLRRHSLSDMPVGGEDRIANLFSWLRTQLLIHCHSSRVCLVSVSFSSWWVSQWVYFRKVKCKKSKTVWTFFSTRFTVRLRTDLIYYVSVECHTSVSVLGSEQYPSLLFCCNSLTGSFHWYAFLVLLSRVFSFFFSFGRSPLKSSTEAVA